MTETNRRIIFLSHSGADRTLATRLAEDIEQHVAALVGDRVAEVFNTSEPEHRFADLVPRPGESLPEQADRYDAELRDYLLTNMLGAAAYLLLVTRQSLARNSRWVAYEIETADRLARLRGLPFFPCVAAGATLDMLPGGSSQYQGIDLGHGITPRMTPAFRELTQAICKSLQRSDGNSPPVS